MTEELQGLLDRIQKDGVEKAETEAAHITDAAEKKASEIVAEAEKKAESIISQAKTDGEAFTTRGRQALEQAARDVILSLRDTINATLAALVRTETAEVLNSEALVPILGQVISAYCGDKTGSTSIEVILPTELQDRIKSHFTATLAGAMRSGIEIKADSTILAGFRVSLVDERVEHDFTDEAISEALCKILRPHLAEIVRAATENKS